jgi:hypothetical protein
MGHELIFIMQRGNMRGMFNVWWLKKYGPILQQPQVWAGNESLVIGK